MNRLRKALSLTAVLSMLAMPTVALTSAASAATSGQVVVAVNQPWTDTGVDVSGSVILTASGTIDVGGPEGNLPPTGSSDCTTSTSSYSGSWVALGFPCWSLIARVGDNPPFAVGNGGTFSVPSGRLFLGVDDETAAFGDNSGSWSVTVNGATSTANCQIDVHAAFVLGYYHLYVVYTDPSGSAYHYEAYPSNWPSPNGPVKPTPGPGSWSILPNGIPQIPALRVDTVTGNLGLYETVVASGPAACGKDASGNPVLGFGSEVVGGPHRCFLNQSSRIDQARIAYHLFSTNSNAYVYTILRNCDITPDKPTPDAKTPGWGRLLVINEAPVPVPVA